MVRGNELPVRISEEMQEDKSSANFSGSWQLYYYFKCHWVICLFTVHRGCTMYCTRIKSAWLSLIAWLSLNFILSTSWVALYSVVCEWASQASVSPDQISTFSNIYRHKSPIRVNCWCWENWGMVEGRFSKWFWVLKQVFWTFSYLYLWHTMWFHAKNLL